MWGMFLFASLLPAFVIFLGIKAIVTGEIQLSEQRKLGQSPSTVVGIIATLAALGTIAYLFAFLILRII
jgi:hypothetical protein